MKILSPRCTLSVRDRSNYGKAIQKEKSCKAKGSDEILTEHMLMAGARLECAPHEEGLSIFVPLFEGNPNPVLSKGYIPLRLIMIFRKIFEMGVSAKLEDVQRKLKKFGFERRTSSQGLAPNISSKKREKNIISSFLTLTKACDIVLRKLVMDLVEERYSKEVSGMVSSLIQPSSVYTKTDESGIRATLYRGFTQGGPRLPPLLNVIMDTPIFIAKDSLRILQQ